MSSTHTKEQQLFLLDILKEEREKGKSATINLYYYYIHNKHS